MRERKPNSIRARVSATLDQEHPKPNGLAQLVEGLKGKAKSKKSTEFSIF